MLSRRVKLLILDFELNMHVKISSVTTERIDMENKVFRIIEGMMK